VRFEDVRAAAEGVPFMSPEQGRAIYDHLLAEQAVDVLEIGTWNGVSAAYAAAALHELGRGTVTTLDRAQRVPSPPPEEALLARLPELAPHIELVRPADSSYVWWLARQVEARSDAAGNCEPAYDFCYLDGAHDFTIDGASVFLVEKLLRPGGWLLLDDLSWTYGISDAATRPFEFSDDELHTPHMRLVFDLLVRQHPSFTTFRVEDGAWGWARKAPGAPRTYELRSTKTATGLAVDALKRLSIGVRSRRRAAARAR
jgi:predicted O-methyltransferase YrrM